MQPRSLRTGRRMPNPGAVHKGCPRPKALRFASPFGGASPFGDGSYSGNIIQGGVPLQPQDYLLDGVTPMSHCIVVTGAATVDPDPETGAAVVMGCNLVVLPGATLTVSGHCKGLVLYFSERIVISGAVHMTALGRAGNFGDLTPLDLTPGRLRAKLLTHPYKALVVKGRGAEGGAFITVGYSSTGYSNVGHSAGPMQTGGGGTGLANNGNSGGTTVVQAGGCGGPCCGGAGSGSVPGNGVGAPARDFGGPGGSPLTASSVQAFGGAAGDPPGAGNAGGTCTYENFDRAGGGLLCAFAPRVEVLSGGLVASDGGKGGAVGNTSYGAPGPGAGGGIIIIGTAPGGYSNTGTVRAAGGAPGDGNAYYGRGAYGGSGSVNTFELAV